MPTFLLALLVAAGLGWLASPPPAPAPWFSGRIIYHVVAQDQQGDNIQLPGSADKWFYVSGSSYKLHDGDQQVLELYRGRVDSLYTRQPGGQLRPLLAPADSALQLHYLPGTVTILGYPCRTAKVVRGSQSVLLFFSDKLRVNPAGFSNLRVGPLGRVLRATQGALPLRTINLDTQNGYSVTSEATSVQPMLLPESDFTARAPAR